MSRVHLNLKSISILEDEEWGSTHIGLYVDIKDPSTGKNIKDDNGNDLSFKWNNLGNEIDEPNSYDLSNDANHPNVFSFDLVGKALLTFKVWADDDEIWPDANSHENDLGSIGYIIDTGNLTTFGNRMLGSSVTDSQHTGYTMDIDVSEVTETEITINFLNLRLFEDEEWGSTHIAIYARARGAGIDKQIFTWNNGGNNVDEVGTYDLQSGGDQAKVTIGVFGPTTISVDAYADDDQNWPNAAANENYLGNVQFTINPADPSTLGNRQSNISRTDDNNNGYQININIGQVNSFYKVKHFFVLMLENRSFDHMLGFSGIAGINGLGNGANMNYFNIGPNNEKIFPTNDACQVTRPDSPHEFDNVKTQLLGTNGGDYGAFNDGIDKVLSTAAPESKFNSGFIASYATKSSDVNIMTSIMKCFDPVTLPILSQLAAEFAVCDRWHSSLPGPTWPNRFFVHAATSGGLSGSPDNDDTLGSFLTDPYDFEKGTIFDSMDTYGIKWRVYHGDYLPQVLSLKGMYKIFTTDDRFKDFEDMHEDINNVDFDISYTFIEPDYGHDIYPGDFSGGNSQHPSDKVSSGEKLIKNVYEIIRNSPIWEQSALIILYDEHGGFYDHVFPPRAIPPGDDARNREDNSTPAENAFKFDRLGVRVPTIIISPFIKKGVVDSTLYDHSSILATLEKRFILPSLTQRDGAANTIVDLFALEDARTDAPATLKDPYSEEC